MLYAHVKRYADSIDNTAEENSSVFCLIRIRQQGHVGSKTLHQENPPVLNWRCRLTQVGLHNGRETVVVVVVVVCTCFTGAAVSVLAVLSGNSHCRPIRICFYSFYSLLSKIK